ncbi:MAG TPA: acyltransferase [Anaeromyxobacter sp.]|nr:acyltransferase [Anaeromyxobacter sp.]
MDSPGSTTALAPEPVARPREAREGAAGVVAALTAYAYLWRCRRVGARARTLGRPLLSNPANVELGADVLLDSRAGPIALVCHRRGRLVVGDGARVGPATRLEAVRYVEIGDRTRIGAGCVVSDAGADGAADAEIWIGDDVTLGDGVRVLPGTVIGAGAVVEAGSVVRGRIPPGAIVAGDPTPSGD